MSSGLVARLATRIKTVVQPGDRLLLGLSGGVDSLVLLDVLARLKTRLRFELAALHVNHQLSANALKWARFCRLVCRERGIACRVVKVSVVRGNSLEGAAREARYAALYRAPADYIVLAHNADDQAETVLLQLLRGAGVKGLSAMPFLRRDERPLKRAAATNARAAVLRPLLDVSRSDIEHYAKKRKLAWVEDESNADTTFLRNWLRLKLIPEIATRVPAYRQVFTRAARNFAEAASLLDELARIDAHSVSEHGTIPVDLLKELSCARAKNLLRFVIASRGWPMPSAQRLEEGLRQILAARGDAQPRIQLGACELRRHAGRLYVTPAPSCCADKEAVITWSGERKIVLPAGVLTMTRRRGDGMSLARLQAQPVTIRTRNVGERLKPYPLRPSRSVKNLLREAAIPAWQRDSVPFIYCGDALACIPGVAVDHRFQAQPEEASVAPVWRPW